MYPITGSAWVITSPSNSSTTRSTPCVEGCCGPMLRIISSVRSGLWLALNGAEPIDEKAVRSVVSTEAEA